MNKKNIRKGAVSIILVMATTVILVFLVAGWQSRLLLSLHRSRAMSDILVLSYHAESKIYDIIAKFVGGFPNAFSFPFQNTENLPDDTELTVSGTKNDNIQTLEVSAKRLYGSTKIKLTREDMTTEMPHETQILLSLDCTGSMGSPACPTCSTTRMDEQKKAVINFLDTLELTEGHERIKVGISAFELKADWLYTSYTADGTPTGTAITPEAAVSLDDMRSAVNNYFGHSGESDSLACKRLLTYTSVGTGFVFMHDYLKTTEADGLKQVEVLITDGEPNQRIPNASCPENLFCPGNSIYCCPSGSNCSQTGWSCPAGSGAGTCTPYARDFVRCALADEDTGWIQETGSGAGETHPGIRNPDVDVYTVTVYESPPANVLDIFQNFSTNYYNSGSADQLTEILQDILEDIISNNYNYQIQRVVPTPIR